MEKRIRNVWWHNIHSFAYAFWKNNCVNNKGENNCWCWIEESQFKQCLCYRYLKHKQNEIKFEIRKNWCTKRENDINVLRMLCVKRVPTLGESGYLQFIQQILPKVIYILNADKNWNNEICIWIRYLLCWSHWKWKHVCVVAQRLGINEIFYKAIWWGNSRLYEEIQYDVKSRARLGTRCFIREEKCCALWEFCGRIYSVNCDFLWQIWQSFRIAATDTCSHMEHLYNIYIHSSLYCCVTKWQNKESLSPKSKAARASSAVFHLNRTPLHCGAYSLQQNQTSCT